MSDNLRLLDPSVPADREEHARRIESYELALDWYKENKSLLPWDQAIFLERPALRDFGLTKQDWQDWLDYCAEAVRVENAERFIELHKVEPADGIPF